MIKDTIQEVAYARGNDYKRVETNVRLLHNHNKIRINKIGKIGTLFSYFYFSALFS